MTAKKPTTKPASSGVFDIARPGSSQGFAASATSRPVIVNNRPVMQDPMMVANGSNVDDRTTAPPLTPVKKVVITPIHESVTEEPEVTVTTPSVVDPPAAAEPAPEPTPKPAPEPVKMATEAAATPEPAVGDDDATAQKMRERMTHIEKLVEEQQYFLPIQTIEERRSRKVALFGLLLIIVLALAWYNTALDANLLPNTYDLPHTSFFTVKP